MSIVHVEFDWDDAKGKCWDCGNPAAYCVPDMYGPNHRLDNANLMCSVCAAYHASTGERIVYIWSDDDADDESKLISDFYPMVKS